MRNIKKVLSVLLAVCIAFGMMSVGIFANAASDDFMKIIYVDGGRKYFTKDWFAALINEAAADGYTHVELGLGNDGLRFLLNDMSLEVNGTAYSGEDVAAGINAGNIAYYDAGEANELTEAEMDELYAVADKAGIEIIPLINTPGHMDAIIDCMEYVGIADAAYNGSARTVDVTNTEAVAFTKALLEKYVAYFASKGSKWFNMGADEYANDIYSSYSGMGFGKLIDSNQYGEFVAYVNDVAAVIKAAGMTPIAFNDGIYYNSATSYGAFDSDIAISYWSSGWSGYNVASASYLANKGHKMINTNGDYYYILGVNDIYTPSTTTAHTDANAYTQTSDYSNTAFMGGTISDPAGSMLCVWSDYPGAETETEVAANLRLIMRAMSLRMDDCSIDGMSTGLVAAGGFNEDGTVNTGTARVTDSNTGVTVSTDNIADLEITELEANTAVSDAEDVVSYEITPYTKSGSKYTGSAKVTLPVPKSWNTANIYGYVVNSDGSVTRGLKGTVENGYITFRTPHFSEIGAYWTGDTVEVMATESTTIYVEGTVGTVGETYESADGKATATVIAQGTATTEGVTTYTLGSSTTSLATGKYIIGSANNTLIPNGTSGVTNASLSKSAGMDVADYTSYIWTVTASGSGYRISTDVNGVTYYLTISSSGISGSKLALSTTSTTFTNSSGKLSYNSRYIQYSNQGWGATRNSYNATNLAFWPVTVSATEPETKEYTEIRISGAEVGNTTVDVDGKEISVLVNAFDLSSVDPVEIEYWITNQQAIPLNIEFVDETNRNYTELSVSANDVHSENGALFSTLVAPTATNVSNNDLIFWKGTLLDEDHHQYDNNSSSLSQCLNGTDFTHIRYWNGKWSVYDGEKWINISSTDQIVAYYMQKTDVTVEISTGVVDWGQDYAEWKELTRYHWFWSDYVESGQKYVFLDFAVVYEDGTQNPNAFPTDNTWFFHFAGHSATNPRVLNPIFFQQNADYEIWKVTVTDGTSLGYSSASTFKSTYDNSTETVVWDETMGGEPEIEALSYTANRSGKLVRIYVRAKQTEDSLAVHYVDNTTGEEFYSYNIAVNSGTFFDESFAMVSGWNDINYALTGNTVTNIKNVEQTVTANLARMTEISAEYSFNSYTFVNAVRGEDGKNVYLYYDFSDSTHKFVVDFGLKLIIDKDALALHEWNNVTVTKQPTYGTATVKDETVEYVPTTVLHGIDSFKITFSLTDDNNNTTTATHTVYIYPATTVYYDAEKKFFASADDSWTFGGTAVTDAQATEKLGSKSNNYGYDAAYNDKYETSQAVAPAASASATFTFTGTGVDFYVNSKQASGAMTIIIRKVNDDGTVGSIAKLITVQTKAVNGYSDYTDGQDVDPYGMCAASVDGLEHGKYIAYINTVTSMGAYKPVYIDGFRVHNTLADSSVFADDGEANAMMIELRDQVIAGLSLNADADISDKYSEQIADVLHSQVYDTAASAAGPVVISAHEANENNYVLQDLIDNGPKNELFLQPGEAVTFSLVDGVKVQLGLRAPKGAVSVSVNDATVEVKSSADMFYDMFYSELSGEVVITNPSGSGNILSITELKVFGAQEGKQIFKDITEQNLSVALMSLGYETEENAANDVTDDINGDGTVNVKDMIRLKKYIAEEDVEVSFPQRAAGYVEKNAASKLSDIRKAVLFG